MESTVRHHYDHSVERVFSILTSADFLKRRSEAAGEKNVVVTTDGDGPRLHIKVAREIERNLPSFAKKIFNPRSHITDVQTWDTSGESKISTWTVQIEGQKRVEISGRLTLAPGPSGGCDYTEQVKVTVHLPLIGGPIEKYVIGETASSIRHQIDFIGKELG
jgi:hypothetical protein